MSRFGKGTPKCARCGKSAYANESVEFGGRVYHQRKCFSCAASGCGKKLEKSKAKDRDDEIFCNTCYSTNFGPVGFRGGGAQGGVAQHTKTNITDKSGSSSRSASPPQHTKTNKGGGKSWNKAGSNTGYKASSNKKVSSIKGSPKCARCGKSAYANESVEFGGRVYHQRKCFSCITCGKKLEKSKAKDREDKIYCKTCYSTNFGPVGFRGGGAQGGVAQYTKSNAVGGSTNKNACSNSACKVNVSPTDKFCSECGTPNKNRK